MVATLFRHCLGCGRLVALEEWQDGPLGCNDCRRHVVGLSFSTAKNHVVLHFDSFEKANQFYQHVNALALGTSRTEAA